MKEMKRRARELLLQGSARLSLTVIGIFLIFSAFLPLLIGLNLTDLLFGETEPDQSDWLIFAVWGIFSILITAPALTLLYRRAYLLYLRLRDGFSAPRRLPSCGVWRCFFAGLVVLLRPVLVFCVFLGAYALAEQTEFWFYLPIMACAIVLAMLVMWLTAYLFLFPYYVCRGESIRRAMKYSVKHMLSRYRGYFGYMLAFLGWVLLSLLTVGVLLILYTIPMMLLTYFIFADKIVGDQQTEDDRHE